MKKLFFFLLTAAAALTMGSCVREPVQIADPAMGGTPVSVSFSVNLRDALTKAAPESSALDNGSGVYRLYVAAFSAADGSLISTSRIGGDGFEPTATVSDGRGSVSMVLSKGQDYKVVFFAQKDDAYNVSFANGNVATFSFKNGLNANDPKMDAFYAVQEVNSSMTSYDVTLKRPFAQVNVLVPADNAPSGKSAFLSTMKVKAPTSFNLFTGAAVEGLSEITFAENAISAAPFGKYADAAKPYKWIGMNYVLVPANGKVEVVSFNETDMPKAVAPGEIPVKVNGRTNLVGSLYGLEAEFTFNILIDPVFGDETEVPMDAEDTEITIVGADSYPESAPFGIDASTSAAPAKVTLLVNGDSFETVNAGADGGEVKAVSSDEKVATAAVNGNDVEITPVGNGKAKITVSSPAYTKADYKPQTFDFWVEVTGMTEEPDEPGGDEPGGEDGYYVKVTSAPTDWSGKYLIVYEEGSLAFNGGLETLDVAKNSISVEISDGKIASTATTDAAAFTIAAMEGGYSIKAANGQFIGNTKQASGAPANGLTPGTDALLNTISFSDGAPLIVSNTTELKYNKNSGDERFRYYKSGNKQQVVALYKLSGEPGGSGDEPGGGDEPAGPVAATLTVSPASLALKVGGTGKITATTNSTAAPSFASGSPAIATVAADGTVTAVAEGTATITVSVAAVEGKYTAAEPKTVSVTVTKAEEQGGGSAKAFPYSQDFKANGQGDFTIDDKTLPEGLTYVWNYDSKYGMKASAFANNATFATESWLISPVVDLASAQKPVLTFRHALNKFSSVSAAQSEATVWAREENGTWAKLSAVTYPSELSWNFIDSGEIDLSAYKGKTVQIAFKYVSSASSAGTWEVDKFSIDEQGASGSGEQGGGNEGGSQGGSSEELGTPDATLTNAEIKTATVDASMTDDSTHYGDASITSTSGTWTGNFARNKAGLNFLQLRNKKGAYLKSPVFSSNIKAVVVTMTSDAEVTLGNRALYAVPPTTSVPTDDDIYTADVWASKYGTADTGTTKGAKVTIEFTGNTKQFTLVVGGGATYIDKIDVYY